MVNDSYTGPAGALRPETPWLATEDIDGFGDIVVEIVDVKKYKKPIKFLKGPAVNGVSSLVFKGKKKELTVGCKARRDVLVALFGKDTKAWRGQRIALYVDPSVKMKGEVVGGIRIRPQVPADPK